MKKFIDKLFGRRDRVTHKDARPIIYGKEKHSIQRELISRCARRTCEELQRAGYPAFVVGGAVRDLLLLAQPSRGLWTFTAGDGSLELAGTPLTVRLLHAGKAVLASITDRTRDGKTRLPAIGREASAGTCQPQAMVGRVARSIACVVPRASAGRSPAL